MRSAKCPYCARQFSILETDAKQKAYLPFCGRKCKLLDLGSWLDGSYLVSDDKDEDTDRRLDGQEGTET